MHAGAITCLAFHPNDEVLAAGYENSCIIRIWNTKTSEVVRMFSSSNYSGPTLTSLSFSPKGEQLAVGGCYQSLHLWRDWESTCSFRKDYFVDGYVTCLTWNPKENQIAVGLQEGKTHIYDAEKLELVKQLQLGMCESSRALAYNSNGTEILMGNCFGADVYKWRPEDNSMVHFEHPGEDPEENPHHVISVVTFVSFDQENENEIVVVDNRQNFVRWAKAEKSDNNVAQS